MRQRERGASAAVENRGQNKVGRGGKGEEGQGKRVGQGEKRERKTKRKERKKERKDYRN